MADWLILGGTRFVGHHIAAAAVAAGHRVTLLHRGHTPAQLEGEVREILADRDGGVSAAAGRRWDCVIDVCGYLPRVVAQSVEALDTAHYCFVSTVSVYPGRPLTEPPIREDDALLAWRGPRTEAITELSYGPLKVACERAVQARHPAATLIRPGYVVGPRDHTHRFSWWVRWLARSGPVLLPDNAAAPIQLIDGRDLAAFAVRACEARLPGAHNCVGPAAPVTWGEVHGLIASLAGGGAEPVRAPEPWLLAQGLDEAALPMWLPRERLAESLIASPAKALAAGLALRPLTDTVRDILDESPRGDVPAERLDAPREEALLAALARA
jgi:2'-hydroxyisoflavone reductase